IRVPARLSDAVAPGTAFMPFHWGDLFGQGQACNYLTIAATDTISKQPELKFCAVAVEKVPVGQAFQPDLPSVAHASRLWERHRRDAYATKPRRQAGKPDLPTRDPMNLREFRRAGHFPSLVCAFLYFDVSFMIWVLIGPLANRIVTQLHPRGAGEALEEY